jgi:regulator of protease activity HflC (stomatin/prohibitin superfamily)
MLFDTVYYALVVSIAAMLMSHHIIEEGHVGVYSRGGRLLEGISEPGLNMALPILTKTYQVQVTVQTDTVLDIPCGTSGGVMIKFDKIEVVNR